MRLYTVTDLTPETIANIEQELLRENRTAGLDHLFWLDVPDELLNPTQKEHVAEHGPYSMALETGKDCVMLELLVRAHNKLHCECIAYAAPDLVLAMMETVNALVERCTPKPVRQEGGESQA